MRTIALIAFVILLFAIAAATRSHRSRGAVSATAFAEYGNSEASFGDWPALFDGLDESPREASHSRLDVRDRDTRPLPQPT